MQVATVSGDQPWICTVYYVVDEDYNLYWLSLPTRRHSQEIAAHNKVAVAVAFKFDKPIIGVQAQGTVEVVDQPELIQKIMRVYVTKYNSGEDFYDNFVQGNNQHLLYRFQPHSLVLFDEVNFKDEGRQEWEVVV